MRIGSHSQENSMNGMCTWPLTVQKRDIEVSSEYNKGVCVITGLLSRDSGSMLRQPKFQQTL